MPLCKPLCICQVLRKAPHAHARYIFLSQQDSQNRNVRVYVLLLGILPVLLLKQMVERAGCDREKKMGSLTIMTFYGCLKI